MDGFGNENGRIVMLREPEAQAHPTGQKNEDVMLPSIGGLPYDLSTLENRERTLAGVR